MINLKFKHHNSSEIIEIIQFNYDGCGNALISRDGEFEAINLEVVKSIIMGENGKESNYIKLNNDEK